MQRYFIAEEGVLGASYVITSKDDSHHIKNVMRMKLDDKMILNFTDITCIAEITCLEPLTVKAVQAIETNTELPVSVTIASGLLKNDKYEWMLQKATELGASHFIPFQSARTVVKWDDKKLPKRLERLEKIIKEAAEQSYRTKIPSIEFFSNLGALCGIIEKYDYVMVAYEEEAKQGETSALNRTLSQLQHGDKVLLVFGPEGGLSEQEIQQLGAVTASLGPRILRAETAPLYALSAISYQLELMR